jgi:hypothetical protein
MRPPTDEDIENYDDIMWNFIDMLQALLDWRKIIDLQYNGETVFRVTMSFPELLGPSHERDIQVVRSWDELPPLPEKHPPGYWRSVWEASQAEQQQPEEAPPEPEEPRYWPVPPPNPAQRRSYPPPEDLLRLKPQPLPSVPSIEDLERTADTIFQSMVAIGNGTAAPWLGFKAMAASLDAMNQFFGMAPAKAAERVPAAPASDRPNAPKPERAPTIAPGDITGMSGLYSTPMSSDDLTKEVAAKIAADLRGFGKGLFNGVPHFVFGGVNGIVEAGAALSELASYASGRRFDGFARTHQIAETLARHNDGTILPVASDEEGGDLVGEFFSPGAMKKMAELAEDLAKPGEELLERLEESIERGPAPDPIPGFNPALTPAKPFLDPAGNRIPTFKVNRYFRFDRTLGDQGSDLETATRELAQQEPGYIASFATQATNGTGIDHAYAKLVDGKPKLFVIEDKSAASSIGRLTALGGGSRGLAQLERNAKLVQDAIKASDIPNEYKAALLEQAEKLTFGVELHISDTGSIPRSRFDSLADMGLTLDRILVYPDK